MAEERPRGVRRRRTTPSPVPPGAGKTGAGKTGTGKTGGGRPVTGRGPRRWALLVASCVLAVVASSLVLTVATYEGRAARDRARGPVITGTPRDAVAWWASRFDSVGSLQHSVVFVEPLDTSAPPPPGLARWPAPG
ncbi:hypothetical protein ACFQ08_29850, partial [Streptosporangium algeriense]